MAKASFPFFAANKDEIYPFLVGYFQDSQRMIRQGRLEARLVSKNQSLATFQSRQ